MSASQPIDVRDMAIVHRTFRSAYAESAHLVRARPTPSPGRVTFLADLIDFGLEMLHHHHASEDLLRYPLLLERVPEQAALAAIPGTSPKAALKVLREAGLKATSKDPIVVSPDLSLFEERTNGEILWRVTGEEQWRALDR